MGDDIADLELDTPHAHTYTQTCTLLSRMVRLVPLIVTMVHQRPAEWCSHQKAACLDGFAYGYASFHLFQSARGPYGASYHAFVGCGHFLRHRGGGALKMTVNT